jgi:hypothetical protein
MSATAGPSTTPAQQLSRNGLHLQVDFAWSKFRNTVSEKTGSTLTPLFVQHFRPTKPQLRYELAADKSNIATGTISNFHIAGTCTIRSQIIKLKPLSRLKTAYNYLSSAFAPTGHSGPVAISWTATSSIKTWDFVCMDAETQLPLAKFSANWWALTEVGNFYFMKPKEELSPDMIEEAVFTGLTVLYMMAVRMNNPLNLVGAAFAKPGKVDSRVKDREV